MPIGWYIVPYMRRYDIYAPAPQRYCAIDDYTEQIFAQGGNWTETEVLGNRAIVKVRTSDAILSVLDTEYKRLPKNHLDDSLSDLSPAIKTALKNELLDMGYPLTEITDRFGDDFDSYTLRDVLRFIAKRRLKPRYVPEEDTIVCDGIIQECRSIESVDEEIQ